MMFGGGVIGGKTALVVPTAHVGSNSNGNNFTFNNVDFGDEHPSRRVIVALVTGLGLGDNLSAFSISGVAATQVINQRPIHLFVRHLPTGDTGSLSMSYSGAQTTGAFCRVWAAYDLRSDVPVDTAQEVLSAGVASADLSCNTRSGGIVVAAAGHGDSGTQTWVGVDKDAEQTSVISNTPRSFAHANVEVSQAPRTITVTSSNTGFTRYALAASFR